MMTLMLMTLMMMTLMMMTFMMMMLEKMMWMIHIVSQATARGVWVQVLEAIGTGFFLYFGHSPPLSPCWFQTKSTTHENIPFRWSKRRFPWTLPRTKSCPQINAANICGIDKYQISEEYFQKKSVSLLNISYLVKVIIGFNTETFFLKVRIQAGCFIPMRCLSKVLIQTGTEEN